MISDSGRSQVSAIALRGGFTLIEVALAILVVAVGLLAVLGLFPTGMNAGRLAVGETREAMYADEVMNGVRAVVPQHKPWNALDTLQDLPDPGLLPPGWNWWNDPVSLLTEPGAGIKTNVYTFAAGVFKNTAITEYSVRYNLEIASVDPNALDGGLSKYIRLEVWNGAYGNTNESRVFYTEALRMGP